jgi:RNA polymerase sigma-70 factor (ECF subfamily)
VSRLLAAFAFAATVIPPAPPQEELSPPSLPEPAAGGPDYAALLTGVAAADRAAFEQIYDNFARPMYALVVRIVGSAADADDVLQIGFHQIWRCAKDYRRERGSPFAWMATIMRRKAIDCLRGRLGHFQRTEAAFKCRMDQPEASQGRDELMAGERQATVRSALGGLNPEEQCAIQLAFFDGLTHGEIARILGAPVGTVKARIRRGMQKLRLAMPHLADSSVAGRSG